MATLDWQLSRTDGVTLVELQVTSDATEQVRIDSTLTPVWPPRQQGVPLAGWDDGSFEGVVREDERLVIGYASPADPTEPPAELVSEESVPGEQTPDGDDESVTARTLVRTLGEATPPRDAVPTGEGQANHATHRPGPDASPTARPAPVDEWLDAVTDRLSTAEELASASTVADARETVEDVGTMANVQQLAAEIERDEERLRAVVERSQRLADRAKSVTVPVETLARVR